MSRRSGFGMCLLALWAGWGFALQGLVAASPVARAWTPDLGVVMLLALEPRVSGSRALQAALVISAARIALTADPPLAIFVGYVFVVGLALRMRQIVEIDRPLPRALLGGCAAVALAFYWAAARSAALAADGLGGARPGALESRLGLGLATAVACVVLSPWIVRLPGVSLFARARS